MASSQRLFTRGFVYGLTTASALAYGYLQLSNEEEDIKPVPVDPKIKRASDILKYGVPDRGPAVRYYQNHVLSYDQARRTPLWVAEHINSQHIQGPANRKHSKFRPDPSVDPMFTAHNGDYWKSGWSRGHMAPAGDNKFDQEAMNDTFLLSNIVPQNLQNNAGFWNRFEMYCRDLTSRFEDVYVVSGPLYLPTQEDEQKVVKYPVIGENEVAVPTHLYKVVVAERFNTPTSIGAFIVPNQPIDFGPKLTDFQVPIEDLEKSSGFKFYPQLDRSKTKNLCEMDSCKLITKKEFELWIIGRKLQSARTQERVEKVWKELEEKKLEPDQYLIDLYAKKKVELAAKQSEE
ncbi:nuclease EXOG, mitochondrial-like [Branchiostoma lanceolatum]|uniref:nuclease EXOG, mitochondrial-like n=1 Tax=Branchiostoma lanceolatum TaxID=7740 RepID=UPI003451DC54